MGWQVGLVLSAHLFDMLPLQYKITCRTHAGVSCQHLRCSSWRTSAPMVPPAPCHVRRRSKRARMAPQAGIKAIESFDATFELNEEQDAALRKLLATEPFCQQVVRETQQPEGTQLEFTGTCWGVHNAPAGSPLRGLSILHSACLRSCA